jgi:hypothetical protein
MHPERRYTFVDSSTIIHTYIVLLYILSYIHTYTHTHTQNVAVNYHEVNAGKHDASARKGGHHVVNERENISMDMKSMDMKRNSMDTAKEASMRKEREVVMCVDLPQVM